MLKDIAILTGGTAISEDLGIKLENRLRDLSTILCSGNRDEERLAVAVDAHQEGPVLPARLGPFFGEI
jgi:hypothetical protein